MGVTTILVLLACACVGLCRWTILVLLVLVACVC